MKRDNFTQKTKIIMAQRVGYNCSNPNCNCPTAGAHTNPNKAILIGVAAHITAASSGGPRFKEAYSPAQRKGIENGIWLCENCAKLIDKDEKRFSISLLNEWKSKAESRSFAALDEKVVAKTPIIENIPFLELDLIWANKSKGPQGLSRKNDQVHGNEPIPFSHAIYYNRLMWSYDIVIYNNSNFPAYNLKIIEDNLYPNFSHLTEVPKVNNISPLGHLELNAKYTKGFEGTGKEALEELKPIIPIEIEGKKIILEYLDELRNLHKTEVLISSKNIENKVQKKE